MQWAALSCADAGTARQRSRLTPAGASAERWGAGSAGVGLLASGQDWRRQECRRAETNNKKITFFIFPDWYPFQSWKIIPTHEEHPPTCALFYAQHGSLSAAFRRRTAHHRRPGTQTPTDVGTDADLTIDRVKMTVRRFHLKRWTQGRRLARDHSCRACDNTGLLRASSETASGWALWLRLTVGSPCQRRYATR